MRGEEREGERGEAKDRGGQRRTMGRRRVCRFCAEPGARIDFKDGNTLKHFMTERGKIIPRRITGNCARHQRKVARALKRARMVAMLPFSLVRP